MEKVVFQVVRGAFHTSRNSCFFQENALITQFSGLLEIKLLEKDSIWIFPGLFPHVPGLRLFLHEFFNIPICPLEDTDQWCKCNPGDLCKGRTEKGNRDRYQKNRDNNQFPVVIEFDHACVQLGINKAVIPGRIHPDYEEHSPGYYLHRCKQYRCKFKIPVLDDEVGQEGNYRNTQEEIEIKADKRRITPFNIGEHPVVSPPPRSNDKKADKIS